MDVRAILNNPDLSREQRIYLSAYFQALVDGLAGGMTLDAAKDRALSAALEAVRQMGMADRQMGTAELQHAASAAKSLIAAFSPEMGQKAGWLVEGFKAGQNLVNLANGEPGSGNKFAVALTAMVQGGVLGGDAARWANATVGAYKVAQNTVNGLNGSQDTLSSVGGVLQGSTLLLGSGLLGPEAMKYARYTGAAGTGIQAWQAFDKGNIGGGLALLGSAITSLFDGPIARIAENVFGVVSNALALTAGTGGWGAPIALGASVVMLFKSIAAAFSPQWITYSKGMDSSGDGINDTIKFERKNDDWLYIIKDGTTHVPITRMEFSVTPQLGKGTEGVYSSGSEHNDPVLIKDGKPGAPTGMYTLRLNPTFMLEHAGPSTESASTSVEITLTKEQYDAMFGAGGAFTLGGQPGSFTSGTLDAHQGANLIKTLQPMLPKQNLEFDQEKKNDGIIYYADMDNDGTKDVVTLFPKVGKDVKGDESMIVRLRKPNGEVYATFARNKDGSYSNDSQAARVMRETAAAEGGSKGDLVQMKFGKEANAPEGLVKIDYGVIARTMSPEEKLIALTYVASHPELAEGLLGQGVQANAGNLDMLAAKGFWHMIYEGSKHGYEATFDPAAYLAANPNLADAFGVKQADGKIVYDMLAAVQHRLTEGRNLPDGSLLPKGQGAGAGTGTGLGFGDDLGLDVFGDGGGEAALKLNKVMGTEFDDRLVGTDNADLIFGGDGNDLICAGTGINTVNGGIGNDTLIGGDERDNLSGGEGNDFIDGRLGGDVLRGDNGNDTIIGGNGVDSILGGGGDDMITAEGNASFANGDGGNDTMIGLNTTATFSGGSGLDIFVFTGFSTGQDKLDVSDFVNSFAAVTLVDVDDGVLVTTSGSSFTVTGFLSEDLTASDFIFV